MKIRRDITVQTCIGNIVVTIDDYGEKSGLDETWEYVSMTNEHGEELDICDLYFKSGFSFFDSVMLDVGDQLDEVRELDYEEEH